MASTNLVQPVVCFCVLFWVHNSLKSALVKLAWVLGWVMCPPTHASNLLQLASFGLLSDFCVKWNGCNLCRFLADPFLKWSLDLLIKCLVPHLSVYCFRYFSFVLVFQNYMHSEDKTSPMYLDTLLSSSCSSVDIQLCMCSSYSEA